MLSSLVRFVEIMNERLGQAVSWLALFMVLIQFVVVLMRYVFGVGWIWVQESIIYMHASIFLIAAGYTLLHNGHVRVDIFYASMNTKAKAVVDLVGGLIFLLPTCAMIFWASWPYVVSSWQVLEISQEGDSGIPAVFLLKSVILVFCVVLGLQGLAMMARSLLTLNGATLPSRPGEVTASTPAKAQGEGV
jgi:TRAP-type mannitol/chloroaromatic compound transport system permease small subunit